MEADASFEQMLQDPAKQGEWTTIQFYMPWSFVEIMYDTIARYKAILGTDAVFPALEMMTMEARNSLPQDVLAADLGEVYAEETTRE